MRIDRVLANNPGPYTGPGTNTWVLDDGTGVVVIIDPGPVDDKHARAISGVVSRRRVEAVLVTHTHADHAPMANPLARDLGVPAIGYQPGPLFDPDIRLLDGARLKVGSIDLEVVYTPGHADDHLCFQTGRVMFTGDHVIGGSSVMVEDMGRYLDSLHRIEGRGLERLLPGHGEEIEEPDAVIDWYIAHRLQRHAEVYEAVRSGADSVGAIIDVVYVGVDPALHPLASRSVEAHLRLLQQDGRIGWEGGKPVALPPSPS
jgi:glyoxylase-like metal-dependent hydrolase (beta-lactamase superfamily II)